MENTELLLFSSDEAEYYLFLQGNVFGPFSAKDIYSRIQQKELALSDFIWKAGWVDFKRISEENEFAVLLPKKPAPDIAKTLIRKVLEQSKAENIELPPLPVEENIKYYIYQNNSQFGPFITDELKKTIESGRVTSDAFLWHKGMKSWKKITEFAEFESQLKFGQDQKSSFSFLNDLQKKSTGITSPVQPSTKERRQFPRKPMVARLFITNEKEIVVAVCRDVSVGGMQVLTDQIPGPVGASIKLNISPADTKRFTSFVAEGEIVRHLEDGRGFSYRFTKLSADAKKMIQNYIE